MKCTFTKRNDGLWQCSRCGWLYKKPADQPPNKMCGYPAKNTGSYSTKGVGAHLHTIIAREFGAQVIAGCGCQNWINQMNNWGPDGSREHRQEIVARMLDEARKRKWKRENKPLFINAATRMICKTQWGIDYATRYCGTLVDEAISMAESAAADTMSTNPQ